MADVEVSESRGIRENSRVTPHCRCIIIIGTISVVASKSLEGSAKSCSDREQEGAP